MGMVRLWYHQRVKRLRDDLTVKFSNSISDDEVERVPIAFKFSDGTKVEHNFSPTSTVKVDYIYQQL